MKIDDELFDKIQQQAEASPRLRMHYDLRTQADLARGIGVAPETDEPWRDGSQRMINVLIPGTVIPIHRHLVTSETVVICRGAVREEFYDERGEKIAEFVLEAGGPCPAVQVPMGMYHTCVCLEPGSVIFEAKDRAYAVEATEDFL